MRVQKCLTAFVAKTLRYVPKKKLTFNDMPTLGNIHWSKRVTTSPYVIIRYYFGIKHNILIL